jgi:hypothetical protein
MSFFHWPSAESRRERTKRLGYSFALKAIPGKTRCGIPSGIVKKQKDRAVLQFREKLNCSSAPRAIR